MRARLTLMRFISRSAIPVSADCARHPQWAPPHYRRGSGLRRLPSRELFDGGRWLAEQSPGFLRLEYFRIAQDRVHDPGIEIHCWRYGPERLHQRQRYLEDEPAR